MNALALLRDAHVVEQDHRSFLRELSVLADAGLLTWQLTILPSQVRQLDQREPLGYLQNVRDLALTVAGRDRARGQLVRLPMEDPEEDDGRPIRHSTLQDVAEIMAHTGASHTEIEMLFTEAGASPDHPRRISGRVLQRALPGLLAELADGSSGQRRDLRMLLGAWLDDGLHSGPSDEQHRELLADFARQGWFVTDSRLVIGERIRRSNGGPTSPGVMLEGMHPVVWGAAFAQWSAGHRHEAIFASAKAVDSMLQAKLGRHDISGVKLLQEAFSADDPAPGKPRLRFTGVLDSQTRLSVTRGALSFGVGCFQAIRNPVGHLPNDEHALSDQEALERLAALSLLARWVEQAAIER